MKLDITNECAQVLLDLILDPTKFENMTNEEFESSGLKDVVDQINAKKGNE